MKMQRMSMLLLLALPAFAFAADRPCADSANTVDDTRCMAAEVDKADQTMQAYLRAAKARLVRDKSPALDLARAQSAWSGYRVAHCGDVYRYWSEGSYRYRASAQCQIDLARARTHDIWDAYLTFADSTPPLLPEPVW